jgi:hypothetical protein
MRKRTTRQGIGSNCSYRYSLANACDHSTRGANVTKLTCMVATCLGILVALSSASFTQPLDRNEAEKKGEASPGCLTELKQLSWAIETYLSDSGAQGWTPVHQFARSLRSLLPVAPCDTQTVRSVLMSNSFSCSASGVEPELEFKFANAQLLIFLSWSGKRGTFVADGTFGRVKFKPHDFNDCSGGLAR